MNDTQFVFDWFLGLLFWKRCTKSGWLFFGNVFLGDKSWEKSKSWVASSFFRWVGRIRVAFGSWPFKFLALLLWFNLLNLNRHYHIFKFIILIKKNSSISSQFFCDFTDSTCCKWACCSNCGRTCCDLNNSEITCVRPASRM